MANSEYPGVGRLAYVLLTILLYPLLLVGWFGALWLAASQTTGQGSESLNSVWHLISIPVTILFIAALIYIEVLRLRNLGMSGWWYLASFLPFINLWLFWRRMACPAGYADHRQLDVAGKIITCILIIPLLLPVIFIIINVVHGILSGI